MKTLGIVLSVMLLVAAAWATQWGPDGFGYTAKDNAAAGGPAVAWKDISTNGTRITTLSDDNVVGPINIGWTFHYYWYDVSQFWVGSNGYIKFGTRGQIVTTYSAFPNVAPPNNVIAPYAADLMLKTSAGVDTGRCFYRTNNTDTLIVAWVNAPGYSSGPTGYHNFEIILSRVDSSITFQYGTQNGTPTSVAVGIENVTGQRGLNCLTVAPTQNTAIKFYYPDTLNYVGHDLAMSGVQSTIPNGFWVKTADSLRPWMAIANLGTQTEAACSLHYIIRLPNNTILARRDLSFGPVAALDTLSLRLSKLWAPGAAGSYFAEASVVLTGDQFGTNNLLRIPIRAMAVPGEMAFDDGASDRTYSIPTNNPAQGALVEFLPPVFPVNLTLVRIYVVTAGAYDVVIFDNDGPGGGPGAQLFRTTVSSPTAGTWNNTTVGPAVNITQGSVFVGWMTSASGAAFGMDTTSLPGISGRAWDYRDIMWGQNKWWNNANPMIRCNIALSGTMNQPPASFTRMLPADSDTVDWMTGRIMFRWHKSIDPDSQIVAYHVYVTVGTTSRSFAVTDTTLQDSLAWAYHTGLREADVSWRVVAWDANDSTEASDDPGTFHLVVPNRRPGAFTLIAPINNTLNPWNAAHVVHFSWHSARDADGDTLTYRVLVTSSTYTFLTDTLFETADTTLDDTIPMPSDHLDTRHNFRWAVWAKDGHDSTAATNNTTAGTFRLDITAGAEDSKALVITDYALSAYPNPFNPISVLSFDVPTSSPVEIKIYNLNGEVVDVLHRGVTAPGRYHIQWNADARPTGTYFACLRSGNRMIVQKLLLLK
jgi:hypothetical protein